MVSPRVLAAALSSVSTAAVSIVRVPVAIVAVVIGLSSIVLCVAFDLRPLAGKEERPPPDGDDPLSWGCVVRAGGPVVSGDGASLPNGARGTA